MWIRQRLQENAVDHGENRTVRTDTNCQRENGYDREAKGFAQRAQGVADVVKQSIEEVNAARLAAFLFYALCPTELQARSPHCIASLRDTPLLMRSSAYASMWKR